MHARDTLWMVVHGDTGVGGIFLLLVIKERVLDPQIVSRKNMKEVLTSGITSGNTVRPKHLFLFITGTCASARINVPADDNLGVWVD